MPRVCCVPNCESRNVLLHRFNNQNSDVFKIWVKRVANPKFEGLTPKRICELYRVCGAHFTDDAKFLDGTKIKKFALPTLYLPGYHGSTTDNYYGIKPNNNGSDPDIVQVPLGLTGTAQAVPEINLPINVEIVEMEQNYVRNLEDHVGPVSHQEEEVNSIGPSRKRRSTENSDIGLITTAFFYVSTHITSMKVQTLSLILHNIIMYYTQYYYSSEGYHFFYIAVKRRSFVRDGSSRTADEFTAREKFMCKTLAKLRKQNSYRKKILQSYKQRLYAAQKFSQNLQFQTFMKNVNKPTFRFFMSQFNNQRFKPRGRRFTIDDKIFALSLYKQSAKSYRLLAKIFSLPSRQTICKMLQKIPFEAGINKQIFFNLSKVVKKLKNVEKNCVLLFDEMSLAPHLEFKFSKDKVEGFQDLGEGKRKPVFANHATVFMVRGVFKKFKQPVAFVLCENATNKNELASLIKKVVREIRKTGLNILATISDQGKNNEGAVKLLCSETIAKYAKSGEEKLSYGYEIDNIELLHLYDVPHLLKGIRNNLLSKNATFRQDNKQKVAKWEHIVQLYHLDQGAEDIRVCPKLSESHVVPGKMKKMKVSVAAQVMSQRVSAIMRKFAQWSDDKNKENYLDPAAVETADFLLLIDKLFDSLNGSSAFPKHGKYLRCAVSKRSDHEQFWNDVLPVLESIRFICPKTNTAKHVPSVINWVYTLKGFKYLKERLFSKGVKFIKTRNFNQDPLENFFGMIRSHGCRNINPSPSAFSASFKSCLISNFVSSHSVGANCEEDDAEGALDTLKSLITDPVSVDDEVEVCNFALPARCNFVSTTASQEGKKYVSGYIVRRLCKINNNCKKCKDDICSLPEDSIISAREYVPGILNHPSCNFNLFFNDIEKQFATCISNVCYKTHVIKSVKDILNLDSHNFFTCSVHQTKKEATHLILKLLLFNYVKNVNKILCGNMKNMGDDPVKVYAQKYYNAHRHNKK